ncbi:unnamed protein product [Adineta ricciae]|uniref:K Homology domain-containing protein n=1 Tax=Adineta ricciae TaxID=249248 RepID=A0A815A024_ADIRI|nr:unnamed protein product [Adineta ricciae]CAF1248600.1 unnamed protein product [Adineta ricciae]
MATANRFQTRVLVPDKSSLTPTELRLNLLLTQAQTYHQSLNDLQTNEYENYQQRESQLDVWASKMFEKIDQLYQTCFTELKQSTEQLKLFQQIMMKLLNIENENYLDAKKLSAIGHEICILNCLTYQLDMNKVKIEGKLKLRKEVEHGLCEVAVDDDNDQELNEENEVTEKKEKKDFHYRILIQKENIEKLQNLPLFQEFVQVTTDTINETTPERVLTITGSQQLQVIENLLSTLYSSSLIPCEIRILLHISYAPLILGKLGDRSKILREKYALHTLTIHPTCAPLSTERVLLIQSSSCEKIMACLREIFASINEHVYDGDDLLLYNEVNYDASLAHEYGGFASTETILRSMNPHHEQNDKFDNENESIKRYSAFDAWNGSVEADTEHEFSVVKLSDDSIMREFWINHGEFGALLGPHGVRIAQIRSQCRTVRIHTVAGSSIDTCSVKVIGPRADVNRAVNLIIQSIKEHDRKFPFKPHRFSGRLR